MKKLILKLFTLFVKLRYKWKIGDNSIVYPNTYISMSYSGGVEVGDHTRIGCFASGYWVGFPHKCRIITGKEGHIKIGSYCDVNGANIVASKSVTIGDYAHIGSGVQITDYNAHEVYALNRRDNYDIPQEVNLGRNVWIGLNAVILKGTRIGDNSIVTAGSVVKGIFPDNCIIQGNPAVIVKHLDPAKFK